MRSRPQVGQGAIKPLLCGGTPPLHSKGAELQVANNWARGLHNPGRLGGRNRFKAGSTIIGSQQVGRVAT